MPQMNKHIANSTAWAIFIQALATDGGTLQELADESGMSYYTISKVLRALHKRKAVHIKSWERDIAGRYMVRLWALGQAKDAKRPARKSSLQRCREYYAKQQQIAAATGCRVKDARLTGARTNAFGVLEAA